MTKYHSTNVFLPRVLTGGPIGGALLSSSLGESGAFINFSGIIVLFGAFILLLSRLAVDRSILKIV